jgi:hypothetical protein
MTWWVDVGMVGRRQVVLMWQWWGRRGGGEVVMRGGGHDDMAGVTWQRHGGHGLWQLWFVAAMVRGNVDELAPGWPKHGHCDQGARQR